ncbi:MAG: DUF3883 domain-containing protein [Desulfurococcaceae archaeon]
MDAWLYLVNQLAENYVRNPFFAIPLSRTVPIHPLLHQTELVARALLLNPTRILLADSIGLGKTVEALRILHALRNYHNIRNVLIIVPATLEKQWLEELRRVGIEARDTEALKQLVSQREKVEGFFVARMDTIKKNEYFPDVSAVAWDAIVVDEAHRLAPGILRSKVAELARKNPRSILLLLSATPHRGIEKLYLYLLSVVDPFLTPLIPRKRGRAPPVVDSNFYSSTHLVLVHRRIKEDVNKVYEEREIFKPAEMLTVLVKPTSEERDLLNNLVSIGRGIVRRFYETASRLGFRDPSKAKAIATLISILLIKRGASSPLALVKTFSRVAVKRAFETSVLDAITKGNLTRTALEQLYKEVDQLLKRVEVALDPEAAEEELEKEPDNLFDEVTDMLKSAGLLSLADEQKLKDCLAIADAMVGGEKVDSKIEFLVRLVELARSPPKPGLEDISGAKIVVFTEFKDTADYIYSRLKSKIGEDSVRILTSENRGEYQEVLKWLESPGVKVLVATDVMSEGLNFQVANVLVNYEVVYNPLRLEQRIGRVWRYGQKRKVYVFNLFLLDTAEKTIHDIFFRKVFNVAETLGKVELGLGEEVYLLATVHNTLYDEVLKSHQMEVFSDIGRFIGAVRVTKLLKKLLNDETRRSLDVAVISKLISGDDEEYSKFLEKLALEFVIEVLKLADLIKRRRIYPEQADKMSVEEFLHRLTGIRNHGEASEISNTLYAIYREITNDVHKPENYVETMQAIVARTRNKLSSTDFRKPLFFAVNNKSKRLLVLYRVGVRIGDRVLEDVVGLEADFTTGEIKNLRGLELVQRLADLYRGSVHVDEVYGRLVDELHGYIDLYGELVTLDIKREMERIAGYEKVKKAYLEKLGSKYQSLYEDSAEQLKPEAIAIFFTLGFLPRSGYAPSTGVWQEFERKYLEEIITRFEKACNRVPEFVYVKEHYDVYSRGNGEERYIECKGFVEPKLSITLTQKEYATARELGENYWLYLVYGAGTNNPVVLAIKNPLHRIRFVKEERTVVEVRYTATIG